MMNKLKEVLERAQACRKPIRLTEYAQEIESRRAGKYHATQEELQALDAAERSGRRRQGRSRNGVPDIPPRMKIDYSKRATADLRQVSADSREFGEAVAAAVESRIQ